MFENINTNTVLFIIVAVSAVCWWNWKLYFQKCKKCGGKFRLDSYKDSMGHNISKKVIISFWIGPRKYTEVWKCQSCGYEVEKKYWSWD